MQTIDKTLSRASRWHALHRITSNVEALSTPHKNNTFFMKHYENCKTDISQLPKILGRFIKAQIEGFDVRYSFIIV